MPPVGILIPPWRGRSNRPDGGGFPRGVEKHSPDRSESNRPVRRSAGLWGGQHECTGAFGPHGTASLAGLLWFLAVIAALLGAAAGGSTDRGHAPRLRGRRQLLRYGGRLRQRAVRGGHGPRAARSAAQRDRSRHESLLALVPRRASLRRSLLRLHPASLREQPAPPPDGLY